MSLNGDKMENESTTKLIDALFARTHFGELMKQVEAENLRFLVSRRGKPKVVILSVEDYLKNVIKQPEILTKVQLSAKKHGLEKITDKKIDVDINKTLGELKK
jgi:prevent-host-death family protein